MIAATEARSDAREAWATLWEIMLGARAQFVAAMADLELTPVQGIVLRRLDPDIPAADIVANAPNTDQNFFLVPKVVE